MLDELSYVAKEILEWNISLLHYRRNTVGKTFGPTVLWRKFRVPKT